jgi:phosphopantothenate-cysteine ligase
MKKHEMNEKLEEVEKFIEKIDISEKIVLITSGGTSVKLEKNTVRSIENFSTGKRGALSCEEFLKNGYFVVFFHREGSCLPFIHNINLEKLFSMSSNLDLEAEKGQNEILQRNKNLYLDFIQTKLLMIQFTDVIEYLYLYENFIKKLSKFQQNCIIYLAAAVSDYYIPLDRLSEHKIQSSDENLQITLYPVPKELYKIKSEWNPNCFLISFKLETDQNILFQKCKSSLEKTNSDYILANILQSRYDQVFLYSKQETLEILKCNDTNHIEEQIISAICKLHDQYINK